MESLRISRIQFIHTISYILVNHGMGSLKDTKPTSKQTCTVYFNSISHLNKIVWHLVQNVANKLCNEKASDVNNCIVLIKTKLNYCAILNRHFNLFIPVIDNSLFLLTVLIHCQAQR